MWSVLFGWTSVITTFTVLIGIAVGVLSMTPPEFGVARGAFTVAALILGARFGWWLAFDQSGTSTGHMAFFGFVVFGTIGAGWIGAERWVKSREVRGPLPFQETLERARIVVGNSVGIELPGQALTEWNKYAPINLDGFKPLLMYISDGALYVDVVAYGGPRNPEVKVVKNQFSVGAFDGDRNFSSTAVEVVDHDLNPIFQIVRTRPDEITISGLFRFDGGVLVADKNGVGSVPLNAVPKLQADRIFQYPSAKHQGELRDSKQRH
jgi:hypothetical protein